MTMVNVKDTFYDTSFIFISYRIVSNVCDFFAAQRKFHTNNFVICIEGYVHEHVAYDFLERQDIF